MRKWVTTLSIFIAHAQTVSILGNLALEWPPPVQSFTRVVALSFVDTPFVRAECLATGANAFHVVSLGQASRLTLIRILT
jgi:hypothetical protein